MSIQQLRPVFVMAGGTGGHVFPALAVANILRDKGEQVVWLGTHAGLESSVVPKAGFTMEWISISGLRGEGIMPLLKAPLKLINACIQAWKIFRLHRPKAVLGMGGFVSGPGGLVAWLLRVPLFIHEQNSIIGLTNRMLSRLAQKNYVAFPSAAEQLKHHRHVEYVGNPVRIELIDLPPPADRFASRQSDKLNLLVIGGSLGAASLNRVIPQAIALLGEDSKLEVKHQCGQKHLKTCKNEYQTNQVQAEVLAFIDDMKAVYLWADLVICRAGALTIAELAAVGLAAILVPYPYAVDDHQFYNALYLQQSAAARLIRDDELNAQSLADLLQHFQLQRAELLTMAENARVLAKKDAAQIVANGILAGAISD